MTTRRPRVSTGSASSSRHCDAFVENDHIEQGLPREDLSHGRRTCHPDRANVKQGIASRLIRALGDHLPELECPLASREEPPFQCRACRVQLGAGGCEQPFALPLCPSVLNHVSDQRPFAGFELDVTAEQSFDPLGVDLLEKRVAA
jgi:hypothetical protein